MTRRVRTKSARRWIVVDTATGKQVDVASPARREARRIARAWRRCEERRVRVEPARTIPERRR